MDLTFRWELCWLLWGPMITSDHDNYIKGKYVNKWTIIWSTYFVGKGHLSAWFFLLKFYKTNSYLWTSNNEWAMNLICFFFVFMSYNKIISCIIIIYAFYSWCNRQLDSIYSIYAKDSSTNSPLWSTYVKI